MLGLELVCVVDQFGQVALDVTPGHVDRCALTGEDQVCPANVSVLRAVAKAFHEMRIAGDLRRERAVALRARTVRSGQIDAEISARLRDGIVTATDSKSCEQH